MVNPQSWDEDAADIIARDGDMEEPPVHTSGHDAFLAAWSEYEGVRPEACDE